MYERVGKTQSNVIYSPFFVIGISILYSKPKKDPPELFSFMQPLSPDVWLYVATAYLILTLTIFVVAR